MMEQNAQKENPNVGTYNFQGNSIKIVVRLSKSSEIEDDKAQVDKADKTKEENEGFKNLIIYITTEDAFSSPKQDVSTDTDAVFQTASATTPVETLEDNNLNSEPFGESNVPVCNLISETDNKYEVTIKNDSSKVVMIEDLGTREKKFRGLWSWVRSAKTPEMQRKNKNRGTSGVISEPEKRKTNEEERHQANVFEQEVDDEIPEIGLSALENEPKDGDTVEQESTSVIRLKTLPNCDEVVQNPTLFNVSKVQDAQEGCSTTASSEVSNVTKRLFKANNSCPEVQEELVYRSFTGCDLAVPQDLLDEDVNSFFNDKPNEEMTDDQELHQNEDEAGDAVKLDDKNDEVLVLSKHQRSSFISRLDKAIHKSKYRKVKVKPASDVIPKPESETGTLKSESKNECLTLPRDDKSTLKRESHDDEVSFLEDFELLFLDSSQNTNLPGYQNDVVLISYKKRYDD